MRTAINYGGREFLFLWSYAIQCKQLWPEMLWACKYDARQDSWIHNRLGPLRVKREADVSVGILMAHGISKEHIERTMGERFNDPA